MGQIYFTVQNKKKSNEILDEVSDLYIFSEIRHYINMLYFQKRYFTKKGFGFTICQLLIYICKITFYCFHKLKNTKGTPHTITYCMRETDELHTMFTKINQARFLASMEGWAGRYSGWAFF